MNDEWLEGRNAEIAEGAEGREGGEWGGIAQRTRLIAPNLNAGESMAAKTVRGDKLLVQFCSDVTRDEFTCELSAVVGEEDGVERRAIIAEISEESPHLITIWGPVDADGWQLDAQEFLRRLQHLVTAFDERRDA